MTLPNDPDARKYYRVAAQRLEEAELILEKIDRPAVAIYIAGYAVECILKSLLLMSTAANERAAMRSALKHDLGHDLEKLHVALKRRRILAPKDVLADLLYVSTWSPEDRYRPGLGDRDVARQFIASVQKVFQWADGRM